METRPFQVCLICSFCSSDRGFASNFFQTPPHDGRPCLRLTVPTAKPVADFHHQVITRAEHTTNKRQVMRYDLPFHYLTLTILPHYVICDNIKAVKSKIHFISYQDETLSFQARRYPSQPVLLIFCFYCLLLFFVPMRH